MLSSPHVVKHPSTPPADAPAEAESTLTKGDEKMQADDGAKAEAKQAPVAKEAAAEAKGATVSGKAEADGSATSMINTTAGKRVNVRPLGHYKVDKAQHILSQDTWSSKAMTKLLNEDETSRSACQEFVDVLKRTPGTQGASQRQQTDDKASATSAKGISAGSAKSAEPKS